MDIRTVSGQTRQVAEMTMQLNKGVDATTFKTKVDTVLRDGKITAQEFKELAKDVKGGEKTLMDALQRISPKFDKKYLDSTPIPTNYTTDKQISKDSLAQILKSVVSTGNVTTPSNGKIDNKKEITSITDSINLLRAETSDENVKEGTAGGKLLAKLTVEVVHGSIIELTKGGLEGKDKLAEQGKDIISHAQGIVVKPEAADLTSAFAVAKNTASMGSCVATFASALMAIKEAHEDGATVKDLEAVKKTLTTKLETPPLPDIGDRAAIKSKIAALDEVIKATNASKAGNITEAIGQLINTAGGLMEFSKAVAPHLSSTVEVAGNGISAFSGIVTGVATTIKESVRLDDNRKLKSRATEFLKNPAKAMIKDKEKEAKTMVEDLKTAKAAGKDLLGEKAGLEKQLAEAQKLPDIRGSLAKDITINRLKGQITTVKAKINLNENDITKLQDTIDVIRGDNKVNKDLKKELDSQLTALKDEKKGLDDPVTGQKVKLDKKITDLGTQKTTLDQQKVDLGTEKTKLTDVVKPPLVADKSRLENEKRTFQEALTIAKALPIGDQTRAGKIANLETRIKDKSAEITTVDNKITETNSKISANDKAINTNKAALEKNKADTDTATASLAHVVTRIADITTEIGAPDSGLTKKISDTKAKIDNTFPKSPELNKLSAEMSKLKHVSQNYEGADKVGKAAMAKDIGIGISDKLDDVGSQVVKRRSIGHSIFGVVKGILATAGGVAATVGAIAGTVLLAATPVGWALAGAAAVIGIGMIGYKVYKTVQRNKTEANLEKQATELNNMKTGLEGKLNAATTPESEKPALRVKIADVEKLQSRVESMQLKKSPKAAIANIINVLKTPVTLSTPPTDTEKNKLSEQNAMKKFVQHVFKLDPDSLAPTIKPPATTLSPEQIKQQKGMEKILAKKMPMFA